MAREYMPVPIQFKGNHTSILSHRSGKCSALVTLTNISLLGQGNSNPGEPPPPSVSQDLIEIYVDVLKEEIHSELNGKEEIHSELNGKEEILEKIARSLDSLVALDPVNTSCSAFNQTDELLLFQTLEVSLLHGWVLDENDKRFDFVRGVSHSKFQATIAEADQSSSSGDLMKELDDFFNVRITAYGLSCLHEAVEEEELAVLYDNKEYHVLHKHDGALFILETNEEVLKKLPNAVWRKLATEEKMSFHVTSNFTPTHDQPKEKLKLADDWYIETLTTLDTAKKKPKSKRNLTEKSSTEDASTSTSSPTTDSASPTITTPPPTTAPASPTIAPTPTTAPASPTIAPTSPTAVYEEEDTGSFQKFLQFVAENVLSATYHMYDNALDCVTTAIGREMGLGYLNYIFDKFEEGICWLNGWDPDDMKVGDNGKKFIISKEPDGDLTADLGIANLLHFVQLVFPHYSKGGILPAYFDSFAKDILAFPEVDKNSAKWNHFVKYMRSPFALKAPLARSTLICEFCRVISLQISVNSSLMDTITRNITNQPTNVIKDWRLKAKTVKPFLHVYHFRNSAYLYYARDRWESSHWHVLKYSRNFIEHVQAYIKAMFLLHDITFVELMLAWQLEPQITEAIRTIVLEYGTDGLFSSSWDHFECSNCNKMPLQLTPNEITAFQIETTNELEVKLLIRLSAKSDDNKTPWGFCEVSKSSSDMSSLMVNPQLLDLKRFLESKEFDVVCITDEVVEGNCILISKIVKAEERKIVVQGPFGELSTVLSHLNTWLKLDPK